MGTSLALRGEAGQRLHPQRSSRKHVACFQTRVGPPTTVLSVERLLIVLLRRFEYAQFLAENSRFQITCLRDLAALDQPRLSEINIARLLRPHMRHVVLIFSLLPVSLFRELNVSLLLQGSEDGSRPIFSQHCATMPLWLAYPGVLASLPELRTIHIRADHDKPHEWFEHDTITVIESLYPLMMDDKSKLQRVVFYLPISPPRANPLNGGKYSEIYHMDIVWIQRQRYRVGRNELGELAVCYENEWPEVEGHPVFYEVGDDGVDIYDGSYYID